MKEISAFRSKLKYTDRRMFTEETMKHPAKIHLGMLQTIILEYTKENDLILDPMAGMGSTGVVCMLHGRNCIMIEYEEKFCKNAKANIELNRKRPQVTQKGHAEIIQGDARYLSSMFKGADGIIFSPPFAESPRTGKNKDEFFKKMEEKHNRKFIESRKMINALFRST
jgi:tRNA G10  N-methylase Trm11